MRQQWPQYWYQFLYPTPSIHPLLYSIQCRPSTPGPLHISYPPPTQTTPPTLTHWWFSMWKTQLPHSFSSSSFVDVEISGIMYIHIAEVAYIRVYIELSQSEQIILTASILSHILFWYKSKVILKHHVPGRFSEKSPIYRHFVLLRPLVRYSDLHFSSLVWTHDVSSSSMWRI